MLFSAIFVCDAPVSIIELSLISFQIIHLLFVWSSVISWLIFICDILLIGFLSVHAYRDGKGTTDMRPSNHSIADAKIADCPIIGIVDSLEHYEVPFFGRLANSFVDNE
jgi:hypothetical protein